MTWDLAANDATSSWHHDSFILQRGDMYEAYSVDKKSEWADQVFASRYGKAKGWLLEVLQGVWFLSGAVRPAWMR
ncbi:hypothetical protein [Pseudomonas sp. 24 E 13]|nr:hypothetical protein [Pseudomonas sp. 24 E 13]